MIAETLTEVLTAATAALTEHEVKVTDDLHDAAAEVVAGGTALLVLDSPSIEYPTFHQRTFTWTAWLLLGRPDQVAARFDPILEALADPLAIERADAQTYDMGDRTFPGYTLTFTTDHTKE